MQWPERLTWFRAIPSRTQHPGGADGGPGPSAAKLRPIVKRLKLLLLLLLALGAACGPAGRVASTSSPGLPDDVRDFPGLTPDEIGRWRLDEEAQRERESPTAELMARLGVQPGMTVADLGAGGGFHVLRLAEAVGPQGKVYAVDVDPRSVAVLKHRTASRPHVQVVASKPDDVSLPAGSLDLALLSETWHVVAHQETAPAFLASIHRALKADGRLAVLETSAAEWTNPRTGKQEPNLRYVDPEETARRIAAAGFRLHDRSELGHEYLLIFRRF